MPAGVKELLAKNCTRTAGGGPEELKRPAGTCPGTLTVLGAQPPRGAPRLQPGDPVPIPRQPREAPSVPLLLRAQAQDHGPSVKGQRGLSPLSSRRDGTANRPRIQNWAGTCKAPEDKHEHLNSSHLKLLKHQSLVSFLESKELTHLPIRPFFRKL